MEVSMIDVALAIVAGGAFLRGVVVIGLGVRTFLHRKRFVRVKIGWVECVNALEPFLLAGWSYPFLSATSASTSAIAAWSGAALVLAGWGLILWTWLSWPSIFVGHAVLEDHRLTTGGAYGMVRHPIYLAAFAIWLGLALGFLSLSTLLVTLLYVIPIYHLYARSEEAMMLDAFGDEYREYGRRVPMWIPRLRRGVARVDSTPQ
jgi:protein-S-isoprenylcysteine O-methyltransferase Ste14